MRPFISILLFLHILHIIRSDSIPIVVNTWGFSNATRAAWAVIQEDQNKALDALVAGCTTCEQKQCGTTVGYGGSPDENGETTLDAMIFDGATMDMGGVAQLRRIKNAAQVARHVLENTEHSFLVGDLATEFAKNLGFKEETLTTNYSKQLWNDWKNNKCQPNFWKNVYPDPKQNCGPYDPSFDNEIGGWNGFDSLNHDTIGVIVISGSGHIVAGTSTNGAKFKIPGRVGDSAIVGAGAYAENEVGAAVATGDGDVMMRFLPSFVAVEEMRRGATPTKAAQEAVSRVAKKYPDYFGAVLAVDYKGQYGAACNGMDVFPFSVANKELGEAVVLNVTCNLNSKNEL